MFLNGLRICIVSVICVALPAMSWAAPKWKPLSDTGQSTCYNLTGYSIPCPQKGQPLSGQDAQYRGAYPSFTDLGNGTVKDNNTGLIWRKSVDINGDGEITHWDYPNGDEVDWFEAMDYCQNLTYAGATNWRVPTIHELETIVDYSRVKTDSYTPLIYPVFKTSGYGNEWSSTLSASSPNKYAWNIWFFTGKSSHYATKTRANEHYVRCVR